MTFENEIQFESEEKALQNERNNAEVRLRWLRWEIWMDFAGTTTLHGPLHVTTTTGATRIYYAVVVFLMFCMFCTHTTYLVQHYLSFPILTEIKYNNIDYQYPDMTVCPNSPLTSAEISGQEKKVGADQLEGVLNQAKAFWWQSKDLLNASPNARMKKSVIRRFYENSDKFGRIVHKHVLFCKISGSDCLDSFIITEHPQYFRCFTLRVRPKETIPSGPTNGIRVLLHRGSQSAPLLLLNEEDPFLLQSISDERYDRDREGYFLAFHEPGTFPNFPIQHLSNGLTLRYGMSFTISLSSTEMSSVDLAGRPCVEPANAPAIQLAKHDKMAKSNLRTTSKIDDLAEFSYTEQACLAVLRQRLTYERCKCFSEAYAIPYSMHHIGQTWCHDIELTTSKLIRIEETFECMRRIANMTDVEVAGTITAKEPGDGIPGCPLRCRLRTHTIHSHQQTRFYQNVSTEELITYFESIELMGFNGSDESFIRREDKFVSSKDLIYLDVSPVSESISQVIEEQGYPLVQLFSELGGVSGLYVGITIYTLAEIVDVVVRYLSIFVPYVFANMQYIAKRKANKEARKQNASVSTAPP